MQLYTHTHTHTHTGCLLNRRKIGLCKSNSDIVKDESKIEQKSAGITLIALVVTIIVLLILAGVSIATLTGNNGILTQASKAKENTAKAEEDENNRLDANNDYINEKLGKSLVTPGEQVEKTKKNNYTDINGDKATIPEGFTVDETENTISKGLVVHGPDKANVDNGSEFVWVPVPDINNMAQCSTAGGACKLQLEGETLKCTTHNSTEIVGKLYATSYGENFGTLNTTYNADSGYREPAYLKDLNNADGSSYNTIGLQLSEMQTNYKNMATNVAKYEGFYVGRYETSLTSATDKSAGTTGTVQSKQGVIPTSANNSTTNRWYGLYKAQNKTYTGTNNSVESSMIWGSQYDRILNWAKEGNDKEKITNTSLGNNSGGNISITGNSEYSNDSINNIRDLGGNLWEWTLEACSTNDRVIRGGDFQHSTSPSFRRYSYPINADSTSGSRLVLYIK